MRNFLAALLTFLYSIGMLADSIRVRVVEEDSGIPVPFANLNIEYPDSTVFAATDSGGLYSFSPMRFPLTIGAGAAGLSEAAVSLRSLPDSTVTLVLQWTAAELQEISVVGRLATLTDSGLSYNMAANQRAQDENTLQALSYVPMVTVGLDGTISVQGSPDFSLYLDGRPYEMARVAPKAFLESLPASSIAKVEVITRPDNKFAADSNRYILNIVLKQPLLDGYVVNIAGSGNTQPAAGASLMGTVKKGKVVAAINYSYTLNGQRHQPAEMTYAEKDTDGNTLNIWKNDIHGDGDWHGHTARAMLKWEIDSVNSIYADAHGQLSLTNFTVENMQYRTFPQGSVSVTSPVRNISRYTAGSTEANIIYRNYFKDLTSTERMTVAYHYTYNPDRRHIRQLIPTPGGDPYEFFQKSDGGLDAHTGMFSYLFRLTGRHLLRFTASDMLRKGHTASSYAYEGDEAIPGNSMDYYNNIAALNITYAGWIGKVYCSVAAKGNHDHFSMHLPLTTALDYSRQRFHFLPYASLFWRPDSWDALYLNYSTSLRRPEIAMLNPFESSTDDLSIDRGNPDLKPQYNHSVSLMWQMTRINNLTLAVSADYSRSDDLILADYLAQDGKMIRSFSNYGSADQIGAYADIDYTPAGWLSLSMDGQIGKRWLHSTQMPHKQEDWTCSVTPRVEVYLPKSFRIGAKYGYYKELPDPWSRTSSISIYSFHASKGFLSGRLNISLTANSPFNRYIHGKTVTEVPTMTTVHENYMTGRSFGLDISYSLGRGKRVRLDRDRTMSSSDIDTGVK